MSRKQHSYNPHATLPSNSTQRIAVENVDTRNSHQRTPREVIDQLLTQSVLKKRSTSKPAPKRNIRSAHGPKLNN